MKILNKFKSAKTVKRKRNRGKKANTAEMVFDLDKFVDGFSGIKHEYLSILANGIKHYKREKLNKFNMACKEFKLCS